MIRVNSGNKKNYHKYCQQLDKSKDVPELLGIYQLKTKF